MEVMPFFKVNDPENPLAIYARDLVEREYLMWEEVAPAEGSDAHMSYAILSAALGVSARYVEKRCESVEVLRRLPRLRELQFAMFHLDMNRLEGIWRAMLPAKDEHFADVDELLFDYLSPKRANQHLPTRGEIESRIHAILIELDPGISRANRSIRNNSYLSTDIGFDGRGSLRAGYPAEVIAEIEALIRKRMADADVSGPEALLDLIRGECEVKVVLNTYRASDAIGAPVYLPRAGWLDGWAAARLGDRTTVLREVSEYFRGKGSAYRPSEGLRAYLIGRDGACRFPGCEVSADRCDVEHSLEYDRGGETSAANCAMFCRHHHNMKTDGRFSYVLDPETAEAVFTYSDGTVISTMPNGAISPEGAHWVQTVGQRRGNRRDRIRAMVARVSPGREYPEAA